ncbi:MAG: alpha/beta hydrolase [Patescibacteria group bacterium]|nr:alpha/beta hydrolase [Patescibacteria group bacterium]
MKRAIIIHGWDQEPTDEWLLWLAKQLKKRDWQVDLPKMPNARYPQFEAWMKVLLELSPDKNTVLIGHSLSCSLILKYLERPQVKVKKTLLVAAWDYLLPELEEEHRSFFKEGFDYEAIKQNQTPITIIQSTNDPYLDFNKAKLLAKKINAKFIPFENAGHFQTKSGYGEFPELLEMCEGLKFRSKNGVNKKSLH